MHNAVKAAQLMGDIGAAAIELRKIARENGGNDASIVEHAYELVNSSNPQVFEWLQVLLGQGVARSY